LIGVQQQQQ
jgi:hypothetical protein